MLSPPSAARPAAPPAARAARRRRQIACATAAVVGATSGGAPRARRRRRVCVPVVRVCGVACVERAACAVVCRDADRRCRLTTQSCAAHVRAAEIRGLVALEPEQLRRRERRDDAPRPSASRAPSTSVRADSVRTHSLAGGSARTDAPRAAPSCRDCARLTSRRHRLPHVGAGTFGLPRRARAWRTRRTWSISQAADDDAREPRSARRALLSRRRARRHRVRAPPHASVGDRGRHALTSRVSCDTSSPPCLRSAAPTRCRPRWPRMEARVAQLVRECVAVLRGDGLPARRGRARASESVSIARAATIAHRLCVVAHDDADTRTRRRSLPDMADAAARRPRVAWQDEDRQLEFYF